MNIRKSLSIRTLVILGLSALWGGSSLESVAATRPPVDWNALTPETAVPGELLIGYKRGVSVQHIANIHAATGATVARQYRAIRTQLVKLPQGMSLSRAASLYAADPSIEYVEPNYMVHAYRAPNDPRYSELWGMQRIRAEEAWDISIGDANTVVAVIDTGINYNHEDIAANIWVNPDEIPDNGLDDDGNGIIDDIHGARWTGGSGTVTSGDPMDDQNHGTHCAGTIGGVGNNGKGVAGVAWTVRLAGMKFLTASGSGSTADAVSAIEYCVLKADKIKILSNSWGGGGYSQTLYNMIEASMNAGQLFVAAAGNDGKNTDNGPSYPASYDLPNIISVAAIDSTGAIASFSNYGTNTVDLGAPGVGILSSVALGSPDNANYDSFQGTSMACPHVAGAAALLWSISPASTWQQVKAALLDSVQANPALASKTATGGDLDLMAATAKVGGIVQFDRKAYQSDADVVVTVTDSGVPTGTDEVQVSLSMTNNLMVRWTNTLTLLRVPGRVTFANVLTLESQPDLVPNSAVDGDMLVARYVDGLARTSVVSAVIDDTPPVLSNLTFSDVTEESVTVVWRSHEPADSRVWIGATVPLDPSSEQGSSSVVDSLSVYGGVTGYWHRVTIEGLDQESRYYVAVLSADFAGNEGTLPADLDSANPADYGQIITRQRRIIHSESWEHGTQGWTVTNVQGVVCWEFGIPRYGPLAAFSGSNCWGTVLDGNYPANANASLSSPAFTMGEKPQISISHWYNIENNYDFGFVEANRGVGWELLATLTGYSGGWTGLQANLPAGFDHQNTRFRFRLDSDHSGELAGWYVDDIVISSLSPEGLYISSYDVVDDAPGGDGDGYIEQNETIILNLSTFNSLLVGASNVVAEVESPSPGVTIDGGPVKTITFGNIDSGGRADSGTQLRLTVTAAPGAAITLLVSISADGLAEHSEQINLFVEERESVTGIVRDILTTAPIAGATVQGEAAGYPAVSTLTGVDGSYQLDGLIVGVDYQVSAVKPGAYSRSDAISITPDGSPLAANFNLGKAYAGPAPAMIDFVNVDQGAVTSTVVTLNNTNAPYTEDYVFNGEVVYDTGTSGWLTVTPLAGTNGAGGTLDLDVVADAGSLSPYLTHQARIILSGNDCSDLPVEIPVTLMVAPAPVLEFAGWGIAGGVDHDGDAYLEPGETAEIDLFLLNNGSAAGILVDGLLSYTGTNAGVSYPDPVFQWSVIPEGVAMPSDDDGTISLTPDVADGTVLPFTLELIEGATSRQWVFDFAVTVSVRRAVSGVVTECDGGAPVTGAEVRVRDDLGALVAVAMTDGAGEYTVEGLAGYNYSVRVVPPAPFAAPAAQLISFAPGNGSATSDFCVAEWSMIVAPPSLTVTIPEGVETNVALTVNNTSLTAGSVEFDVQLVSGMVQPAALAPLVVPPVPWDELTTKDYVPNELLVRFKDETGPSAMNSILGRYGLQSIRSYQFAPALLVKSTGPVALRDLAASLMAEPSVQYVEPNYRLEPYRTPDDTFFAYQWALQNTRQFGGTLGADMNILPVWDRITGASGVVVAIVDSGTDYNHPDLTANCVPGYDYGEDDLDPSPAYGVVNFSAAMHGTHVAGTVGASGNNAEGIAGVAWQVGIMPLKIGYVETISTPIGEFDFLALSIDAAIASVEHCIVNNVPISNHSYGGSYFSGLHYEAFRAAYSNGHLAIAAAGNDLRNNNDMYFRYPVGYELPNIIGVAASDPYGEMTDFSNYGSNTVEIIAPGQDILSTVMDRTGTMPGYDAWSGTSMASPQVAGAAALLKAASPAATYDMIKRALLDGARRDDNLQGMVGTGHLDVEAALEILGTPWISIHPPVLNIGALSSSNATVTLNAGGDLLAGTYEATILVQNGLNIIEVPVTLNVTPAPAPRISDTMIYGGDEDGFAEPGETIALSIELQNNGSALLIGPGGTLSTTNSDVTINPAASFWTGMASSERAWSQSEFGVIFGGSVSGAVPFVLTVTNAAGRSWSLPFEITVEPRHSITGLITDAATSVGLPGIPVEYWGDAIGMTTSRFDGTYAVHGLFDGDYRLRPLPVSRAIPAPVAVTLAGANGSADFAIQTAWPSFDGQLDMTALIGSAAGTSLTITNSGASAFDFRIVEMPMRKVALISDGNQLNSVAPVLEYMGFDVSVYSNNYYYFIDDYFGYGEARGYFTSDPALLAGFDLVIADLSGPASGGRLLSALEEEAITDFLSRGRTLLLTGPNPVTRPDDIRVQTLVGSGSLDRGDTAGLISVSNTLTTVPEFIAFSNGEIIQRSAAPLDRATEANNSVRTMLLGGGEDPKAFIQMPASGGQVIYWGGNRNGSDWSQPGTLQDYLRTLLADLYWEDVPWLNVGPASGSVDPETGLTINLSVNTHGMLEGVHQARLIVPGNYPGAPVRSVAVQVTAEIPTLRVMASVGVKDWLNRSLPGNGGPDSAVLQVIYAGIDGIADPAQVNGEPSGDDEALSLLPGLSTLGRMGVGYEGTPGLGRFSQLVQLPDGMTTNAMIYVRAWDRSSFASSVAYGDSPLYQLRLVADETKDFLGWLVGVAPGYPGADAKDTNGDGVPDGYAIARGLDPRTSVGAPLVSTSVWNSVIGASGSASNRFNLPSKAFVAGNFLFVLDTGNHRISVWDRTTQSNRYVFGGSGTMMGKFNQPAGMGRHPSQNIFAVADKSNHRIQVFEFEPVNGTIVAMSTFGSQGTGNGQFNKPEGVAIDPLGRIIVADTMNHRIQIFSADGTYISQFGSFGTANNRFDDPTDVAVDENGLLYVADRDNHRIQIFNGSGTYLWTIGGVMGSTPGRFQNPRGVAIGVNGRIFVADTLNYRLQMFDSSRNHLLAVGIQGSGQGQLMLPFGVAPVPDSGDLYAVDTYNHRIQLFSTTVDSDGDGLDDLWELDQFGNLDQGALDDFDGDGVSNGGEKAIGTDPTNPDTDGDLYNDGDELAAGTDPFDPADAPPYFPEVSSFTRVPGLMIRWTAFSGQVFKIQTTTNLMLTGSWTDLPGSIFTNEITGDIGYTNGLTVDERYQFFRPVYLEP